MNTNILHTEPQAQLRCLYQSLVSRQENITEFRILLSQYPADCDESSEPLPAIQIRERLNKCVRTWTGQPFAGFTVAQLQMWRAIVIDGRFALSPWRES